MANKYYYLIASLPHLVFGEPPRITREEFLSECGKWLDTQDLNAISSLDINNTTAASRDSRVLKGWKAFDLALRKELADIRRTKKEGLREKIPIFFKDIFEEQTPLLMERKIQKKRWDFLEGEKFGYHFDTNVLILYFLQLQVLERLAVFDKEKGKAVFEELCEVKYG